MRAPRCDCRDASARADGRTRWRRRHRHLFSRVNQPAPSFVVRIVGRVGWGVDECSTRARVRAVNSGDDSGARRSLDRTHL